MPIAAEVAGLEPVRAENSAQATTELMASPPATFPSQTCAASSRSRLACDCPKTAPISTKSGIASRAKLFSDRSYAVEGSR